MNKSQTDSNSCKEIEEKTENVLQEQDKTQNKKQNQLDIDPIPNVATDSRMECELVTHIDIREQIQRQQPEDLEYTDKKDKREESPKISEKAQKKASQNDENVWEEFDDDVLHSLSLFHDEVKSND